MSPRVLVAGIGNIFRTDDGFGCAVVARLGGLRSGAGADPENLRVVDYGIRGMHLAYDLLEGWDVLVLVDAVPGRDSPGRVEVLQIGPDDIGRGGPAGQPGGQVDAHGMDPATVLANLQALGGQLPARTLLVGCQVADTADGMGLTPQVEAAVDEAVGAVRSLLARELEPSEVG